MLAILWRVTSGTEWVVIRRTLCVFYLVTKCLFLVWIWMRSLNDLLFSVLKNTPSNKISDSSIMNFQVLKNHFTIPGYPSHLIHMLYFQTDSASSFHLHFAPRKDVWVCEYPTNDQPQCRPKHTQLESTNGEVATEGEPAAKIPCSAAASHSRLCSPSPLLRPPAALGKLFNDRCPFIIYISFTTLFIFFPFICTFSTNPSVLR